MQKQNIGPCYQNTTRSLEETFDQTQRCVEEETDKPVKGRESKPGSVM